MYNDKEADDAHAVTFISQESDETRQSRCKTVKRKWYAQIEQSIEITRKDFANPRTVYCLTHAQGHLFDSMTNMKIANSTMDEKDTYTGFQGSFRWRGLPIPSKTY